MRVGISLFGPIAPGRVSGLAVYQERLQALLGDMGLEVRPFFFSADPGMGDGGNVIGFPRPERRFYLEAEGQEVGLAPPRSTRRCVERLLALFDRERLDALVIVEWMPVGMALWEAALRWGRPVVFLPTEHGAVCQYGFLLRNSGVPCDGPGEGDACALCTHGLDEATLRHPIGGHWYSNRHRAFQRATRWIPGPPRRAALWALGQWLQPGRVAIRAREAGARVRSARRFLRSIAAVAYQSPAQRAAFEGALRCTLPAPLPLVLPLPQLFQGGEPPARPVGGPTRFLFAARPDFDRGLWLLLEAWRAWSPAPGTCELLVATHTPSPAVRAAIEAANSGAAPIGVRLGALGPAGLLEVHSSTHYYVNPAAWREPLSSSVLEGMSLGTPAIVPSGSGSADFVRSGENGFVYPFRSVDGLVAAMREASQVRGRWGAMSAAALAAAMDYATASRRFMGALSETLQGRQ